MRQYVTASIAVVLLLLGTLLTAAWGISYWRFFYYNVPTHPVAFQVVSSHGVLIGAEFPTAEWAAPFRYEPDRRLFFLGFGYEHRPAPSGSVRRFFLPHWFLIALLLLYPLYWFRHTEFWLSQKRQRQAYGLCVQCGYDLRASTERCPECGTKITR